MKFRSRLGTKLFMSYVVVVSLGALTLLLTMSLVTPLLYDRIIGSTMQGMMGGTGGMMSGVTRATEAAIDSAFRETVSYSLMISSGAALIAALVVSLFVSRRLVAPIRRLSAASHRIAVGHYAERVTQPSGDELQELAESFNQMATSLEETERRRLALIGDVAHELRTPLSTIEGYAEGLMDGVVESGPETFALLHTEAGRLRRLVDDLQELSRAEARQLSLHVAPTQPERLVTLVRERLEPQFVAKGVALTAQSARPASTGPGRRGAFGAGADERAGQRLALHTGGRERDPCRFGGGGRSRVRRERHRPWHCA